MDDINLPVDSAERKDESNDQNDPLFASTGGLFSTASLYCQDGRDSRILHLDYLYIADGNC